MKTVQECGHRCALRSYDWLTGLLLWNQSCSWPAFRPLFLPSSQTLHFSHGSGVRATDVLGNREGLQLGLYYQPPVGHKQLPSITAVLHVCQDTEILGSIRRKFFFLFFFFTCSYWEREFHQNVHFNPKSGIPYGTKEENIMCKPE